MARLFIIITFIAFASSKILAQDSHSVQVKAFDQRLKPLPDLEISVDGKDFFLIGPRGTAFVEMSSQSLPPKAIDFKDQMLEAESWNYSKGVLEIIVRKKNYRMVTVLVRTDSKPVGGTGVSFRGVTPYAGTTDSNGFLRIPFALSQALPQANHFIIDGYQVQQVQAGGDDLVVIVKRTSKDNGIASGGETDKKTNATFKDFDLKQLDSIRSLTVFYAVFKNSQLEKLTAEEKALVDRKFRQLVAQLEDSVRNPGHVFLGKISDSSFVGEDVKNLLAQAQAEERTLDYLRESFDDKIRVLNDKLEGGRAGLDAETRTRLLDDISRLENILRLNEQKFYKNQNDYRAMLNTLKERFFDIEELENRLSISEAQRVEDQKDFRRKLFTVVLITLCFVIMTVMLFYLSRRLRKQKSELELANQEIKRINENLEGLVFERTAMLENAHREMDIFLYKASHDLRGPICSIIGLCNIASRTVNEDALELVQKTYNTAFAMDRMLKKLKTISEINQPSNYSLVQLDEQINAAKMTFMKFIRDNKVDIKIECPAAVTFHSYPNLVEVIIVSLLENALYYSTLNDSPGGPHILIRVVHKKDHVEITVRDNGIGIDEGIRDRVWEMFFIGSEHSHGNGLGLYIVRKSVEVLGGSVSLTSQTAAYTEVKVLLPVEKALLVPPPQRPRLEAAPTLEN